MMLEDVSVDKLSLVGNRIDSNLQNLISNPFFNILGDRKRAEFPYTWQYSLIGGGILQIGDEKDQSDVRIEFNPNKIKDDNHNRQIKDIISCMKYVRPTRVDVAIDIKNIDINDYAIIDQETRKRVEWKQSDRNETIYIGAERSDLRLRIYDKAKDLKDKHNIIVNEKWWRIEGQLRSRSLESCTRNGIDIPNPFEDISIIEKDANMSHIDSLKEKVFIKHLLENPDDLGKMSKSSRSRYKKRLLDLGESNSAKELILNDIFKENKHTVTKILEGYMKESFHNDVI